MQAARRGLLERSAWGRQAASAALPAEVVKRPVFATSATLPAEAVKRPVFTTSAILLAEVVKRLVFATCATAAAQFLRGVYCPNGYEGFPTAK